MPKERLLAFTDGVIAIIITIMVLEIKVPHDPNWSALTKLWPVFHSYVLSFVNIAIYWNNHHHMMHTVERVNAPILWANMNLLFWLSLIPFTTGWMGETHYATAPTVLYCISLLLPAISYTILKKTIIDHHGKDGVLAQAIGEDFKGKVSLGLYVLAIVCAFFMPLLSHIIYVAVAAMWFLPDKRIERALGLAEEKPDCVEKIVSHAKQRVEHRQS